VNRLVGKVEYVFHLAALTSVIQSMEEPETYIKTNIDGTFNLLEACRAADTKRLVFSSSASVYGDAQYLPVDENHPLNPKSPYAVTKLAAEKFLQAYFHAYGVPAVALRYFNIYGPRQDTSAYANVISVYLRKFQAHQPVTVYGDGEQTRDLIYVQDAVAANLLAAVSPRAPGEVFNIATGEAPSINELIRIIRKVSGWEGQVNYVPERAGEIKHSRANITKAKELLDYRPGVALEQGLTLTGESLKQNR
jgi:UDP-glucose 4-epimerase